MTTEVALCVYDANGRVLATGARPDPVAWKPRPGSGFVYKDGDATPAGLDSITLQARPSPAGQLRLRGKGGSLPALAGPLALPVRAQVRTSDDATCWESAFAGGVSRNDGTRFKAR